MANVKISQLPAASSVSAGASALPMQTGVTTYKATPNQIVQEVLKSPGAIGATTPAAGTFSTMLVVGAAELNGTTIPSNSTLVTDDATQGLVNKTITLGTNTLSGTIAQFNTACSDADFVSTSGSATLTNKTVNLATNTVTGTIAQFNTACSDADFVTLAGSESLTNKTISATGQIKSSSPSAGVGYDTGAGGTVTQATNRTTAVTLNKICGEVVTVSAQTLTGTVTDFTVNNSTVAATDNVLVNVKGVVGGKYSVEAKAIAAGSFVIQTHTITQNVTDEVLTFNFSVIKSVNA